MKDVISRFILSDNKQIEQKSAFWNMMFSGINALQSAIMLLMVTRLCGAEEGGTFALAYATAQLMYVLGSYSVRTFHVTDTRYIYSYQSYVRARIVTSTVMAITSLAFCLLRGYGVVKAGMILAACAYKLVEVAEDLDHGELQRYGRLDVAGREGTLRICLTDFLFFVILAFTQSVLLALIVITIVASLITMAYHKCYKDIWRNESSTSGAEINGVNGAECNLLRECFPLFASDCMYTYISNAAKYAIDTYLNDTTQTYFSVIFMPTFTINLLSSMIYRPQMKRMSELWNGGKYDEYRKNVSRQIMIIAVLFVVIVAVGLLVGLRLLGLIYGLELGVFSLQFAILLLGGGLSALYSYLYACITIMRKQKVLLVVSGIAGMVAFFGSGPVVATFGVVGACWIFLLLMLLETVGSTFFFVWYYRQAGRSGV